MSVFYREYIFPPDFPFISMHLSRTSRRADFVHFHNCIEIAFCSSGDMNWNVEGQEFRLHPGEFCLIPPFATHSSYHPEQSCPVSCYYFFLEPKQLLAPLYPNGLPEAYTWYLNHIFSGPYSGNNYPQIVQLLQDILQENTADSALSHYKICADIDYLMILMSRQLHKNTAQPDYSDRAERARIFPAVRLINDQPLAALSSSQLASVCHITQKQFLNDFRRAMGKTPARYIREARIQKACSELIRSEKSIADIAFESGFLSLSSFNRSFLNIIGQTPSEYRSERREIRKDHTTYLPLYTLH